MRLPVLLAVLCLVAPLTACEAFELGGARHATLTYTDDARAAYNEALKAFKSKDWDDAKALFDRLVEAQPVLVRISAAKRLRDQAESEARRHGEDTVTAARVAAAGGVAAPGVAA